MIRLFPALVLAMLPALPAAALDRAGWQEKRALLGAEAERLRAAFARYKARVKDPAEDVVVPIDSFDDGTAKATIHAEKAYYFLQEGMVWGEGVTLRQLRRDGSVEAEVKAASCLVDRETKSGWAEGATEAAYGNRRLSGEGAYFSLAERYFRMVDRTVLVADGVGFGSLAEVTAGRGDAREKPMAEPVTRKTRLCSHQADYDNEAGVIRFEGDVTVDDGEYRLASDVLWVFTEGTNEVSSVEAVGNVTLTNAQRRAACARAVYDRRRDRLEMFAATNGEPAKIVEDGERRSEIAGRRIVFWLDSEQVEVEASTVTIGAGLAGEGPWTGK